MLIILQIITRLSTFASFGFLSYYVFKDFKNIGLDNLTEEGETILGIAHWALISLVFLILDYIIFSLR